MVANATAGAAEAKAKGNSKVSSLALYSQAHWIFSWDGGQRNGRGGRSEG